MVSRHLYTDLLYFRHITHQRRSDRYVCPLVYLEIVNKLLLCLHLSFSHILFLTISITARHPSYRPFLLIPCFIGSFSLSHPISLTFPSLLLLLFAPSLLQLSYMYCHLLSLSLRGGDGEGGKRKKRRREEEKRKERKGKRRE